MNNGRLVKSVSTKNFSVELMEYDWNHYEVSYTSGRETHVMKTTDLKHALLLFDDTLVMLEGN